MIRTAEWNSLQEQRAERLGMPQEEYRRILQIAERVRHQTVPERCQARGRCAEVSIELSEVLADAGINHEVVAGYYVGVVEETQGTRTFTRPEDIGHIWIRFPKYGNLILDPTADQFGGPKIWFPADEDHYSGAEFMDPAVPVRKPKRREAGLSPPGLKVRVRNHLRHPPRSCLCHRSKTVDRIRRSLVRRLS